MQMSILLLRHAAVTTIVVCIASAVPAFSQDFPKADQDQILDHTNFTPARGECFKFLGERIKRTGGSAHVDYPDLVPRNVCLYAKKYGYEGKIE